MNSHDIDEYYSESESELTDFESTTLSCILTLTDLEKNKNRFYVLQLICNNKLNKYILYIRYGRIGEVGKVEKKTYTDYNIAVKKFKQQFRKKTQVKWHNRLGANYIKRYTLSDVDTNNVSTVKSTVDIKSDLAIEVQNLINLISNKKMFNQKLINIDFDLKKLPIGNISIKQLDIAELVLQNIQNKIIQNNNAVEILKLTNQFYKYVPYTSGRKKPPLINSLEKIKLFYEIITYLKNIKEAYILMTNENIKLHPYDNIVKNLKIKIYYIDKSEIIHKILSKYVHNTHGPTHKFKLDVKEIYRINTMMGKDFKSIGNNNLQLLFHGSSLCNWCSIFKNGLVLNGNDFGASITGKMFGNGVYFTNSSSKSAQYCGIKKGSEGVICLLLSIVSLGNECKKIVSDPFINYELLKSKTYDSVWGQGKIIPSNGISIETKFGSVYIPNEKLKKSNINSTLRYDEKVVYNTCQILPKYIVTLNIDRTMEK
jgi:predicted DNA-binding WGR domain protein